MCLGPDRNNTFFASLLLHTVAVLRTWRRRRRKHRATCKHEVERGHRGRGRGRGNLIVALAAGVTLGPPRRRLGGGGGGEPESSESREQVRESCTSQRGGGGTVDNNRSGLLLRRSASASNLVGGLGRARNKNRSSFLLQSVLRRGAARLGIGSRFNTPPAPDHRRAPLGVLRRRHSVEDMSSSSFTPGSSRRSPSPASVASTASGKSAAGRLERSRSQVSDSIKCTKLRNSRGGSSMMVIVVLIRPIRPVVLNTAIFNYIASLIPSVQCKVQVP